MSVVIQCLGKVDTRFGPALLLQLVAWGRVVFLETPGLRKVSIKETK